MVLGKLPYTLYSLRLKISDKIALFLKLKPNFEKIRMHFISLDSTKQKK
jgi:hypothetical protein